MRKRVGGVGGKGGAKQSRGFVAAALLQDMVGGCVFPQRASEAAVSAYRTSARSGAGKTGTAMRRPAKRSPETTNGASNLPGLTAPGWESLNEGIGEDIASMLINKLARLRVRREVLVGGCVEGNGVPLGEAARDSTRVRLMMPVSTLARTSFLCRMRKT